MWLAGAIMLVQAGLCSPRLRCIRRPHGQALLPWNLLVCAGPVARLCSPGAYTQVLALWPGSALLEFICRCWPCGQVLCWGPNAGPLWAMPAMHVAAHVPVNVCSRIQPWEHLDMEWLPVRFVPLY